MADASDGRKEQRTPVTSERSDRFSGFRDALERRTGEARLRTLEHYVPEAQVPYVTQGGRRFLNFCSNDYLGLAMEPEVVAGAVRAAKCHGTGSGGSRLVVGGFDLHERLEVELAAFTFRPCALLFTSGFQANTSIIPAVTDRESLVLCDVDSHASIRRGCRLSRARLERFRHNDPDHLDALLTEHGRHRTGSVLIVTESIFSMDGDRAPLDDICEVAERHDALLMVDDAHAIGLFGQQGEGLAAQHDRIDLLLGTFGKAFGASGAFVACNDVLHSHLVNFCSGFIYTTAPAPPVIGAVEAALKVIRSGRLGQSEFRASVQSAHRRLRSAGFDTSPSDTQIIPIRLGDDRAALACAEFLRSRGILAIAIRPPTVPEGTARLRVSLSRLHTPDHVDQLVAGLQDHVGSGR